MAQKYGYMANHEPIERTACLVCDDPQPSYSWTDYSGEAYCRRCGTAYQLKWGKLAEGETYPRINIDAHWIPVLRRFYAETKQLNGSGSYIGFSDYPEQLRGRQAFNAWMDEHKDEYADIIHGIAGRQTGDGPVSNTKSVESVASLVESADDLLKLADLKYRERLGDSHVSDIIETAADRLREAASRLSEQRIQTSDNFSRLSSPEPEVRQLFDDHSVALEFVREIARGECQVAEGCICLLCRARTWLHTEGQSRLSSPEGTRGDHTKLLKRLRDMEIGDQHG